MPEQVSEQAANLHRDAIVIDGLIGSMTNLDPILAGGVTAGNVTLASSTTQTHMPVLRGAMEYHDLARVHPDRVLVVERAEDIETAKREGKAGVLLGVQGCDFVGRDLDLVWIAYRCGLRIMQPTYNEENALGFGCLETVDTGLKAFGRQCVREFNRIGMVVDLSHVGERTALDTIAFSESPSIVSHANVRALNDNPRCLGDDVVREIAAVGGVVGISTYASFCETTFDVRPTIDDVVKHIAYVVELVGVDHVGIGTDKFEGRSPVSFERAMVRKYPEVLRTYMTAETRHAEGVTSSADAPRLTQALLDHGLSEEDVRKILGLNFLRVFREVLGEKAAA